MKRFRGYLFFSGAFFLAGTSVITARLLSGSLGIFTISAASLFFALCAIMPFRISCIIKTVKKFSTHDWFYIIFQAATGIFFFRMFLMLGIERTSTLEAGLLTGAIPAITVVLARLVLKEALSLGKLAGLLCTCIGIVALQADFTYTGGFSSEHMLGNVLVFCAAACESCFNVFSRRDSLRRKGNDTKQIHPADRTALVTTIAFLLCFMLALFESPAKRLSALDVEGWLALAWYGVMATVVAFALFYAGITRCEAGTAAAFSGIMPFTAFWLSVLVLGERAGWVQAIGGALVILGVLMISRVKKTMPTVMKGYAAAGE